ncbi:TolC family protein, partial [Enterobacter hormaechei]
MEQAQAFQRAHAQQDVARETLRIAQNRYRNGYSSYLDVLDAQRTL